MTRMQEFKEIHRLLIKEDIWVEIAAQLQMFLRWSIKIKTRKICSRQTIAK